MSFHMYRMLCNLCQQTGSSMSDYGYNFFFNRTVLFLCMSKDRANEL